MTQLRHLLLTVFVLAPLACSRAETLLAQGQDPKSRPSAKDIQKELARGESKFIRFVDKGDGEGHLDTAITSYRGPNGEAVDLIAAVHVADRGYYKKLKKMFEGYDALLYEMVKPKNVKPKLDNKRRGLLSMFQRGMTNVLDLEFQLDGIDYMKSNFVHADLDVDTFAKLSKDRGESIVGLLFKQMADHQRRQKKAKAEGKKGGPEQLNMTHLLAAFMSRDSSRVLKHLLARQLQHVEVLMAGLGEGKDGKGSVILTERNKRCIEVLRKRLARGDRKLGVFYGGAHMPDLEERLRKMGYKLVRHRWILAWDIKKKPAPKKAKASRPTSRKSSPR